MAALRPHYVRDELIGPEAWRKLVARWGGGDYCVPKSIDSRNGANLVDVVGRTAAQRLIGYAGGERIYVHASKTEILDARAEEILSMRARGMTIAEIAAVEWPMRYTQRLIYYLLDRAKLQADAN